MQCPHCRAYFAKERVARHSDKCLKKPGVMDAVIALILELSTDGQMVTTRAYNENRGDLPGSNSLKNYGYPWSKLAAQLGLNLLHTGGRRSQAEDRAIDERIGAECESDIATLQRIRTEWPIEGRLKRKCYWDWRIHVYRVTDLYELR